MSLGLRAAAVTVAPSGRPYSNDPNLIEYYRDLVVPFGLEVDEERLRAGPMTTHTDMVDVLVGELSGHVRAPDLVILTHALPDLTPYKAVASHLNLRTGGRAHSFSIAGGGIGSPFLALRVALAYARSGRSNASLIAVLEQTTLPYRDPLVHDGAPLAGSGVLLSFDSEAGPWRCTSIIEFGPGEKPAVALRALAGDGAHPLAVVGPWTEEIAEAPFEVHRVAPGRYATSVWSALGRHAEQWAAEHDVLLLCDTDPRTGLVHAVAFECRA